MAPIWKPHPIEIYKSWIESIKDEASDKLSDWESNFINDIDIRLGYGYQLSENQARVLERIYTEKTS